MRLPGDARRRPWQVMALAIATAFLAVPALPAEGATKPSRAKLVRAAKKHRLKAFPTCDPFLAQVRSRLSEQVGPYGLGSVTPLGLPVAAAPAAPAPEAAPVAGVDYSPTNVQEAGVDEPDLVKSDGRTMFTVVDGTLRSIRLSGASSRVTGSLTLGGVDPESLLLAGTRLLVLARKYVPVEPAPAGAPGAGAPTVVAGPAFGLFRPSVVIVEVDVSDPGAMKVAATLAIDDSRVVDARLTGHTARIVLASALGIGLPFSEPTAAGGVERATVANRTIVLRATAEQLVPRATLTRTGAGATHAPLVRCPAIRLPARYSGLGLLSILTVDLRQGLRTADADAIVSDGDIVYASPSSMYVATTRWFDPALRPVTVALGPHTVIHRFDTRDPLRARYRASGSVKGFLHKQWSMSEHRGNLRVATTDLPPWSPMGRDERHSLVTVLGEAAGALIPVGVVGGIGRGEDVYAVRFIGDEGYIVTFRRIDPLHVLDLSDPARPRLAGELVIPGYSSYLHLVGPRRLLGVGQDADATGRVTGAQVSLFDVSDPRRPRRIGHHPLGRAWSDAEWDHHAFLFWPPAGLTVLPLQGALVGAWNGGDGVFTGAVALRTTGAGIDELARIEHPVPVGQGPWIRRAMVARGNLYTVSGQGVMVNALGSLVRRAWVPFP